MQMRTLSGTAATVARRSVPCVLARFAMFFIVKIAWPERLVFPQIHPPSPLLTLLGRPRMQRALDLTFHLPANSPVRFRLVHARPAALELRSPWDSVLV